MKLDNTCSRNLQTNIRKPSAMQPPAKVLPASGVLDAHRARSINKEITFIFVAVMLKRSN